MLLVKNIAMHKIHKRYINKKKIIFMTNKKQNDCVFSFNDNAKKISKT